MVNINWKNVLNSTLMKFVLYKFNHIAIPQETQKADLLVCFLILFYFFYSN